MRKERVRRIETKIVIRIDRFEKKELLSCFWSSLLRGLFPSPSSHFLWTNALQSCVDLQYPPVSILPVLQHLHFISLQGHRA
ncbi:hypothetical protein AGOR_G00125070 [Albula goreensis]|uniref:Uncharacterized protein n=1 Tax=Albula goreensis TaxID=1534307 RepID=A0A8T3D7N8_9TELE|nr:hypothetical protein AGOR_G00125070 [Albula goreensis]